MSLSRTDDVDAPAAAAIIADRQGARDCRPQGDRACPSLMAHCSKEDDLATPAIGASTSMTTLVAELEARYKRGSIYSFIGGDILLMLNPFRHFGGLHSASCMAGCAGATHRYNLPPHIFTLANTAFNRMRLSGRDQEVRVFRDESLDLVPHKKDSFERTWNNVCEALFGPPSPTTLRPTSAPEPCGVPNL